MTTRDDILLALLAADPGAALKAYDTAELHARFARAQAKLHNIEKSSTVNAGQKRYNFAPLEDFLSMARAELSAEGLSFHQPCFTGLEGQDAVITVQTVISFGVASIECSYSKTSSKADIQGQGSMITYLRRYTLQAMIGVCGGDEDDDAVTPTTGTREPSKDPKERERGERIRAEAKAKAEAAREAAFVEPAPFQEQARPWPALNFHKEDPPAVADARYVGAVVMELIGPDFFGNPARGEGLYATAQDVGEAMLSKAPMRPQGPDQVIEYTSKMRASVAANPKRLQEIKDRIVGVLVPF
jgi:hypothetical protein